MLYAAKAYAALIGSVVTALLGTQVIPVEGAWHIGLTIASVILTAVATYEIPNKPRPVVHSTGNHS
jgi:hypothetical protein